MKAKNGLLWKMAVPVLGIFTICLSLMVYFIPKHMTYSATRNAIIAAEFRVRSCNHALSQDLPPVCDPLFALVSRDIRKNFFYLQRIKTILLCLKYRDLTYSFLCVTNIDIPVQGLVTHYVPLLEFNKQRIIFFIINNLHGFTSLAIES